jgi:hypothetical protein
MEYETEDRCKQRQGCLLSDLTQTINEMDADVRKWVTSALNDISTEQDSDDVTTDEIFYRYSAFNVGPLRTACMGSFTCTSFIEALDLMKIIIESEASEPLYRFPDSLLPLNQEVIKRSLANFPSD